MERNAGVGAGGSCHARAAMGTVVGALAEIGRRRRVAARPAGDGTSVQDTRPGRGTASKRVVGLWIDHRKAIVVALTDQGEETRLILSHVDKQLGRPDGVRSTTPYESQQVPADDSRQRKLTGRYAIYYDAVIACLRGAESILVFGPGEAKGEFRKRLERKKLHDRIVVVETVDKMTDNQVAAKVRRHFGW